MLVSEYVPGSRLPEHYSARSVLGRRSLLRLSLFVIAVVAVIIAVPSVTQVLVAIVIVIYCASTIDRNYLLIKGLQMPSMVRITDDEALALPDDNLPVYTVLLPVFDEPSIVENLVDGVGRLNYPTDKLEVLILVEEDDRATRDALVALPLKTFRTIVVPHSMPQTKPKACNYGMFAAAPQGEFLTIYDAEDIPDPLQLRKAVVAFRRAPGDVGCLQARLGYFNERQNLLTRWFTMEYDQWFGVVLPAIEAARSVVLLGGTSNHMRTEVWREVGGWDEYNVTEDADLGVRLARHGYRTQILDSLTLEEGNSDTINWIRQRSRWYKGYLQTMLVHLRDPRKLVDEIGLKATLRLVNMTGGIPITKVFNLALWLVMVAWIAGRPALVGTLFSPLPYFICLAMFLIAAPMSIYMNFVVIAKLGKPYLWWAAVLAPLYWILQSLGAVKALYQLIFRPFFWEKTVHGLTGKPVRSTDEAVS